jgi:tetratricopeptide (TPR) repeat protein
MKFLPIILIFLYFPEHGAMGQSRESIDSLNHLLGITGQDSTRIKIFGQLCWIFASTRDKLDSARIYADSIYSLAVRIEDERAIIYSHFYYGIIDRHEGNLARSLDYFEKYVTYHRNKGNDHLVATGLYQVGVIHSSMGNYAEALAAYHEVLNIHQKNDYRYGIGFTLNSMGGIQRTFKNYQDAIKSYRKAIGIFEDLKEEHDLSICLQNLGNVYAETGLFDSALNNYGKALAIDTRLDKKYGMASEMENLGNLYFRWDSLAEALDYHLKSLVIRRQLPQKRELATSFIKIGEIYIHMNEFERADNFLRQGLDVSREIGARPLIMESYEQFAFLHESRKDYFRANVFQKQYNLLKDSIFNDEKIKQVTEIETRFKTAEKDKQILLLSKENEIKEAKVRQQAILKFALMGMILLVLAIAGLIYHSLKQKLRNQRIISEKNEEIKITRYQQELSALEMKALRSQMNPHFIFNCMNSINRMIMSGEKEEASRYLNKFSRLLRLTLENSEHSLISLEDELSMVEAYIQLESIRFKGKINYEIDVDEMVDTSSTHLPSMVLQPFIENAIWHGLMHKSEPGRIRILIRQEEEELKCTIEDDGVGREMALRFSDQANKSRSLGLKITEERLKLISKQKLNELIQIVDLKDSFNQALGTRVNISIPLN